MNDSTLKETTVGDVLTVARELYGALLDARPFVADMTHALHVFNRGGSNPRGMELLDRIDGALADAGEILGGRTL